MITLSRLVRFAVNGEDDRQLEDRPSNSFAGFPALLGLGHFLTFEVTVSGSADRETGCLINIKQIDQAVRNRVIAAASEYVRRHRFAAAAPLLLESYARLRDAFPSQKLEQLRLELSPFSDLTVRASELPMVELSQKFEFAASHRLHNPNFSDADNSRLFGKCNNPHGHGHNYVLQVTVAGKPDASGQLLDLRTFEKTVASRVIDVFDHKNLNAEVPQFADLLPTVENIAMVIYRLLKPHLQGETHGLKAVTVWETSKTCAEFSE